MEMEAAAPPPKKRKSAVPGSSELEEISSHEPPAAAAAMEAANPHIQQPPPGVVGAEEGADRISGLPDAVLGDIISLLPTREGARTQSLASRWRQLWRSAPLNLDCGDLPGEGDVLISLISQILSSHAGPGRRLRISGRHLCHEPATVDAWLRSTALSNLQELEVCLAVDHLSVLPVVAASTFRLSSTLRVATISQCRLPDDISETLHFPQLKQLTLEEVSISEGSLHRVIAGCPVLESMLLNKSTGFGCIRICSPTLRTIGVRRGFGRHGESSLRKIILEDARCLERLLQLDVQWRLDISIISTPNLEIMGCLNYTGFHFSDFQQQVRATNTPWRRKHKSLIRSLDIRLKKIVLKNYTGTMRDVNFAMFFVLNAKVLELFRFEVLGSCSKDFIASQRRLLQLGKRASRGARFKFTRCPFQRKLDDIKHVQDLSVADPLE